MTVSPSEVDYQRRMTTVFIGLNPVTVALRRPGSVPNGAGGTRRGTVAVLPPQTVRLLPGTSPTGSGVARTVVADGAVDTVSYIVLLRWDADVQEGDEMVVNGRTYSLHEIALIGNYEKKASAVSRG